MTSDQHAAKLAIIILGVEDVERSTRFYEAAFGWRRVADVPVYVELALPDGMRLGLYQRESFALNTGIPPSTTADGGITASELYIRVEDIDAAIKGLKDAGARELDGAKERSWGDVAAYFSDPDGNVVAISKPLD